MKSIESMIATTSPKQKEIIFIQIDESKFQPLYFQQQCYFGKLELYLETEDLLQLKFIFDKKLICEELQTQQIEQINRQQYQLTKQLKLNITNLSMTTALKNNFKNVKQLGQFIIKEINNTSRIVIDREKMLLTYKGNQPIEIYFNLYKTISKGEALEEKKRFESLFNGVQQKQLQLMDPDLLAQIRQDVSNQQLIKLSKSDQNAGAQYSSLDQSEQISQQINEQVDQTQGFQGYFNQSIVQSFEKSTFKQKNTVIKQNQIPIYERFRGLNVNLPRKEKITLAERMLKMGYNKYDIVKFLEGGAEQLQSQHRKVPDYRNPSTFRYKQIHKIVAKKQNKRHNQLRRQLGLPPLPEIHQFSGSIQLKKPQEVKTETRIHEILKRCLKQDNKFRNFQQLREQLQKQGITTTINYLQKLMAELYSNE